MFLSIDEAPILLVLISTADFQSVSFGLIQKRIINLIINPPNQSYTSHTTSYYRVLTPPTKYILRKNKPIWMQIWSYRISPPSFLHKIFLWRNVFLELSCFFHNPEDVGNLISGSSAFSKTNLNIWKFTVHILLKPGLENFEHDFTSVWDERNCAVVHCPRDS